MDFFYWGKKPLKEGFQFFDILNPQTTKDMNDFFIGQSLIFFTAGKKPLKEGFQFLIFSIHKPPKRQYFFLGQR